MAHTSGVVEVARGSIEQETGGGGEGLLGVRGVNY